MSPGMHPVQDVGIGAIEIYFPKNVVNQTDLEKFDGCSKGKYTVGLGQEQMGFCADNEDVVSISLTVTDALLRKYEIEPSSIGFLAVGTETLIDKSKSVKTELMKLFGDNHDIEGVDVKNACFGGTQAVFHAIDWVYANYSMEKRNAIAVLADIAVYEPGPARSTGGAAAIAVLITPDAPIAFDRGLRATYMASSWDFYKPIGKTCTEYPIVDGPVSLQSYMNALDSCYVRYKEKALKIYGEALIAAVAKFLFRDYENGKGEYNGSYAMLGIYDDLSRILFFAYGSGSASAMFSAKIRDRTDNRLSQMQAVCRCAITRLDERLECTPETYTEAMKMREVFLASEVPVTPKANGTGPSSTSLFPGTYYLRALDEKYRRSYEVLPYRAVSENHENGIVNGIQGEGDS
ncbi:hydroxymethylglutaryl-CoA synthase [Teladorsagia circumcincta]|uniref:Hydroxymethylglutaryl-CoA synthase n=1 Tax=Teladorsagia circumcincta TaxID=45464 RepID=A0A2G9TYJ0_TELCI|nr:hydroxymethylglutaryl-CoA synthase [Teladorsagia circumcincta]